MTKAWRALVIALMCLTLLAPPTAQKARADIIEFSLLLVYVALASAALLKDESVPPGSVILVQQLKTAVEGARDANLAGDSKTEASRLSKAIGAAQALIGMTSTCNDCSDLRSTLQQIIGRAASLKAEAVGGSGSCHPNGSIQPNEQCDPLAIPTGCPVTTTELTYCSDECNCVPVPIP